MDQEENVQIEKPKKKRKFLKFLITFLILLALIIIILGFIFPGLLWTQSLGITYTKADYDSAMNKLNYIKDESPKGNLEDFEYIFGESTKVEINFTSEEITAFLNENRPDYYAIKKVQVRINEDGTIEAVGSANVDYFLAELLDNKYSREDIKNEMPVLGFLPKNVNLYFHAEGSIINNQATPSIKAVSVQGIPIPKQWLNEQEAIKTVTDGINNIMKKHNEKTGSNFEEIKVVDGNLLFKAEVPTSLQRVPK